MTDNSPIVAQIDPEDSTCQFFALVLKFYSLLTKSTPGMKHETFDEIFDFEEYIASLPELNYKLSGVTGILSIPITVINSATILYSIDKVSKALLSDDTFKAAIDKHFPGIKNDWGKIFLVNAQDLFEQYSYILKDQPDYKILMEKITH